MALCLDPAVVETKMAERGWRLTDLADAAGVSIPTAWRALRGQTVSVTTANKIQGAFARHKPKAGLIELLLNVVSAS